MHYDDWDIMVMEMVKTYLLESVLYSDEDYRPKGGIYIKDRRLPLNDDLVEINLLGKLMIRTDEVTALINVNIYNQYPYRTKELSKLIKKVFQGAIINGFEFGYLREWYNDTAKRKYQNILFHGVISKNDFEVLVDSYF
jgi:hypothetical protein